MTRAFTSLLASLAGSKKFAALALGLLLLLCVHALLEAEQARSLSEKATALIAAYLIGQGVADHGKEAALTGAKTEHPSSGNH